MELSSNEVWKHRLSIYLKAEDVEPAYFNSGGMDQLVRVKSTEELGNLGLPPWMATLAIKISTDTQEHQTTQIGDHPELMALMLEARYTASQKILELSLDRDPRDEQAHEPDLLRFSGPSFMTSLGESLRTDENYLKLRPYLSDAVIEIVEKNRSMHESALRKHKNKDEKVTVWISAGPNKPTGVTYASIASGEYLKINAFIRMERGSEPIPMGILGPFERREREAEVVFIDPMWIWRQF